MINVNNRIIFFQIVFVLIILILGSCGKMDDTYRQFLKDGETIYVAKADSLKIMPGRDRVELSWLLLSDPKVKSYKIYWNSRRDSVENSIQKTEKIDTIKVEIKDLVEGTHTFEIYTYDASGNSSIKTEISGKTYGDRYENSLLNATISEYLFKDGILEVIWNENQPEGLSNIEFEYMDIKETLISKSFPSSKDTISLTNFPSNGEFKYRSGFLPDSLAIDTFYADYLIIKPVF